ncbi:transcriptional regulator [Vibrio sp. MACH09]|uniref:ATP-binding protein n=1 Tax=unclassified Vibrio TaxID=2614977 RepID=UPI0014935514|nr:ATP-binding protein [Vibrio sp. MACH09]NOI68108.1 cyclic nucleotide-binding domain-containing protein [Vibrio sp. 99-8-1]GLO60816.1 transcriptional regulator [Vibrio sp. MACH09]
MNPYLVLYLDDDPISAELLRKELSPLSNLFDIYCVDSPEEAMQTLEYAKEQQQKVAMAIAASSQSFNGADFLIHLDKTEHSKDSRKVLLSDGEDIDSILAAVNEGRLDHCLTKPLKRNALLDTAKKELTTFILGIKDENWLHYSGVLDQSRILSAHIENKLDSFRTGFIHNFHELSDTYLADQFIGSLLEFFSEKDETKACRTYSPDHLLTVEGEPNQFLWFIVEGEVALYKADELQIQREVVRHAKGNIVGGMSFVTGELSFSTAITLTKTKVIKLNKDVFAQVMHSDSELLPLFTNLLLRHFNRRLQRSINTKLELQQTYESLETAHQQLIEREKMAILGQLVAGVAHELNNPVAAILRGADTLTSKIDELIHSPLPASHQELGASILNESLLSRPMSTSEIRQQTKSILPSIGDKQLAKKVVQLNLHHDLDEVIQLAKETKDLAGTITGLEKYHVTGSTLRSIQVCAKRIADMVKSLKGYARQDDEIMHVIDLHEGIEDTLVIFENKLKRHTVIKEYQSLPEILCLTNALQQVWTNLVSNAIDAFPEHGVLTVSTEQAIKDNTHYAKITFEDNGEGIPQEQQDKIFELNYTTKKEGNFGLGIGLSVCQQILAQHSGWIEVESSQNEYTKMIVWLPFQPANAVVNTNKEIR